MTNERPLTAEEYAEAEFARGYTKGFEKGKLQGREEAKQHGAVIECVCGKKMTCAEERKALEFGIQGVITCFRDKEKNWLEVAKETVRLREALEKIKNYQFKKDVLKVGAGVVISDGFVDCKEIAKKALENRGSADGIGCEGQQPTRQSEAVKCRYYARQPHSKKKALEGK
jgi:hypothetical protein